ncbi:unnamed protein product [Linum tenue]|uniref:Uncharacterized protein n=2 Tax=Linum TaxID=4005 RepID=A0AAV0R2R3_9ROSI|nr:unnamed protein product [Linum tenue]
MLFRCLRLDFAYSALPRWPGFITASYLTPRWVRRGVQNWGPQRWSELGVSIVDELVWSLVSAVESVALVSMLCFFFLFCGCTI